jgi:hypothetical protein
LPAGTGATVLVAIINQKFKWYIKGEQVGQKLIFCY